MNQKKDNKLLIDFSELVSAVAGEGLEQLTRQIAVRKGMQAVWSGRGADSGKDLLITEIQKGPISSSKITWLVSCKDKAKSGDSVSERDLPYSGVKDKLSQHKADGFLLVTTTTASTAAKELLDRLDKSNGGDIHTLVWDASELAAILLEPQNADMLKQFLPESYKRIAGLTTLQGAVLKFRDQIPDDVLQSILKMVKPYSDNSLKGSVIWRFDEDSAAKIDVVVKKLLIEEDIAAAVLATQNIDYEAFVALLYRIQPIYKEECLKYLLGIIKDCPDRDIAYNAFQFLSDEYHLSQQDIIKLSPYLNNMDELIHLPVVNEYAYAALSMEDFIVDRQLEKKYGRVTSKEFDIDHVSFTVDSPGIIKFVGEMTVTFDADTGKHTLHSQYENCRFEGHFDEHDVHIYDAYLTE